MYANQNYFNNDVLIDVHTVPVVNIAGTTTPAAAVAPTNRIAARIETPVRDVALHPATENRDVIDQGHAIVIHTKNHHPVVKCNHIDHPATPNHRR